MTDNPSTPAHPVAVKKKATRASKPKVRTACRTCKRRRVKCDEAKPYCQRCTRAKLACEGYGIFIDVGAHKHLIPQGHILTAASSYFKCDGFIFYRGLNALSQLTELENSSYDFARACTVNDMSTLGCPHFWSTTVLQSCHSEPAILHAVLALGAAHRSFTASRMHPHLRNDSFAPVALSHYGKAIKYLRSGLVQTQPARYQVILIVCVILLSFDLLQQRYPAALTHLRHGRRLLKLTCNSKTPDRNPNLLYLPPRTQSIDEELIYSFSQIDLQATNFGGNRPEFILVDSPDKEEASALSIPDTFASVDDAGRYILILMNDCWRLSGIKPDHSVLHNGNPEAVSHQRRLLKSLKRWEAAFAKSRLRPFTASLVTDPDARKALILEIHHALITINVSAILAYPDQLIFDSLIDSYSTIVSLAAELLPSLPIFNFDAAIILPLYHTALNCRHPTIRRRAIDLLHFSGREGMWDSRLVATCAKEVLRLEEELAAYQHDEDARLDPKINLSELIPDNARIAETWMFFVDEKQEVLRLVQKRWKHPERLHTPQYSPADIENAENWEVIDYHVPVIRT